jgi:hypothetical protein
MTGWTIEIAQIGARRAEPADFHALIASALASSVLR